MDQENLNIKIFKTAFKKKKGRPISYLKEVKTNGSEKAILNKITFLKESRCHSFEVHNLETKSKTIYKLLISGVNYEVKNIKSIDKNSILEAES